MSMFKAFELVFGGVILLLILFTFLSAITPILFGTIDNAPAGTFQMGSATEVVIGLIGFIMAAALIYAGVREALTPEDRTQMYGPQGPY